MSLMRCDHCDNSYDSDVVEFCQKCSNNEVEHATLRLGAQCESCGYVADEHPGGTD